MALVIPVESRHKEMFPRMKPNMKIMQMRTDAAEMYHENLAGSPAEDYLYERGLLSGAEQFQLGYVSKPAPGHDDMFINMLSIPYITPAGVVGFKFRRIQGEGKKYLAPAGQKVHIYNVYALIDAIEEVLIVEGELDAIAATINGHPAAALGGTNAYRPVFARCVDGVGKVLICTDNDKKEDGSNPGQELAKKLAEEIPNSIRVSLPYGEDINSTILSHGAQFFTDLVKATR